MLTPGMMINGYRIGEEVSRGAMAKSYLATKDGTTFFLKLYLSPKPSVDWYDAYVAYQRELKRRVESSTLRHFAIRFVEFFESTRPPRHSPVSKLFYQVFEYVGSGSDLAKIITQIRARPTVHSWDQRLTWAKVIMGSVAQLHDQNIVHVDLKPENLILIPDARIRVAYRLKLIDLDFSVLSDRRAPWHDKTGYVGTPGWFSPEHLRGEVPTEASDVFTCGLILYDLLASGNPYADLNATAYQAHAYRHAAAPPALAGSLPSHHGSQIEETLHRCLSPDARRRPSALEVNQALVGVGTPPPPPPPPSDRKALSLKHGGRSIDVNITTKFSKYTVRSLGEDSKFWDKHWQFTLERSEHGWRLVPNPGAPNETMINGKAVLGPAALSAGDRVSVGRESKGIEKLPLVVSLG